MIVIIARELPYEKFSWAQGPGTVFVYSQVM